MKITIESKQTLDYLRELVNEQLQKAYDDFDTEAFNEAWSASKDLKMDTSDYDDFDSRIAERDAENRAEKAEWLNELNED